MTLLLVLFVGIQLAIAFQLVFPVGLLAFSGLPRRHNRPVKDTYATGDYAIIITAYGQVDQVPALLESIAKLTYPNFTVYVVADNCDSTHLQPKAHNIVILRPEKVLAANVKSHFYAIDRFVRPHNRLLILDSDNLVHPQLLSELNQYFEKGYRAVQGLRSAKNLDSTLARLDAARDIYYHFYDGKILFKAGSSATLSGSGMAFDVALYRECLENYDVSGAGFDKVLQAAIVSRGERIAFAESAIVYDEKTATSEQLVKQRARWINTWFKYAAFGFRLIGKGLQNASLNQFLFGLVLVRPPLFMFLILSVAFTVSNLFIWPMASVAWMLALLCFFTGFRIALIRSNADRAVVNSLYATPKFVYYQLAALLKTRKANKLSVATRQEPGKTTDETLEAGR